MENSNARQYKMNLAGKFIFFPKGFWRMNALKLVKLVFEAEVITKTLLPGYLGNTIRGALGKALAARCCENQSQTLCGGCDRAAACVYAQMFKSVYRDAEFTSAPNPYAIDVGSSDRREYSVGDTIQFNVLLFGSATRFAEEVVLAARAMFGGVFGGAKQALALRSVHDGYTNAPVLKDGSVSAPEPVVWNDDGAESIKKITEIEVEFITPTQILRMSKLASEFDFDTLTDSLFNRISSIIDIYGDKEFVLPYRLPFRKPQIAVEQDLRIVTIKQEKQPIVGMVGKARYSGELTRYMPYIDLGTQLHIGKMATRGCGQYKFKILA
jgi:hypothetical protein